MKQDAGARAISHVNINDLKPGALWNLFESGAKAVCLEDDHRVTELWERVANNNPPEPSGSSGWKEFWNNGILTFAKNHFKSKTDYGDLFWFEPEAYGYIARKVVIFPDAVTGEMQVFPKTIFNDNGEVALLSQDALKLAWELAMDILSCALPQEDLDPSDFVVHLELLKYPDSYQDLERMFNLVNAGSAWKRVGIKLDQARIGARGPFAGRFVRDGYAWLSILPGIGKSLQKANHVFGRSDFHKQESGYAPVGEAHVDGCRFMTLLASDRDVMKTEAYCDGKWEELPMTSDRLVMFPGSYFDPKNRVQPTIHRYSIRKEAPESAPRRPNLTLLLGISTRKMFEERKPG
jgi:hypothetical protein